MNLRGAQWCGGGSFVGFFRQEDRLGRNSRSCSSTAATEKPLAHFLLRVLCGQSHRNQSLKLKTSPHSAFSLVELLVVVAILAILAAVGSQALGDRKAAKARGGAEVLHSLFGQARNHAVLKRANTRVVVQTQYRSDKPEDYLRAVAIVEAAMESGKADWTKLTQVTAWKRLPEGVFFSEERSDEEGTESVSVPGGGTVSCAYFEFQPNGQRSGPARVVVEEGMQVDGTFTPRGVEGAYGFMLYPMGQRVFMDISKIKEDSTE